MMLNKVKGALRRTGLVSGRAFIDYRRGTLEDMVFIPAVHIKGDVHDYTKCDSCEKKVKTRNCSLVIFERDDEDADPLCFCQSCANMMRQGV